MDPLPRRKLLRLGLGVTLAAGATSTAPLFVRHALAADVPRFALGLASGQPQSHGMVLWTMLTGPDLPAQVPVQWEVAEDEAFTRIAARGLETAVADDSHGVQARQPEQHHRNANPVVQIARHGVHGTRCHRLTADARVRGRQDLLDLIVDRLCRCIGRVAEILLCRQLVPAVLLVDRECGIDNAPVVDRASRAGRDAIEAEIALLRIDDVVVGVVRDCADRARCLARVAADADLGIDEMLLFERGGGGRHLGVSLKFSAGLRIRMTRPRPTIFEPSWIVNGMPSYSLPA